MYFIRVTFFVIGVAATTFLYASQSMEFITSQVEICTYYLLLIYSQSVIFVQTTVADNILIFLFENVKSKLRYGTVRYLYR